MIGKVAKHVGIQVLPKNRILEETNTQVRPEVNHTPSQKESHSPCTKWRTLWPS